MSDHRLPNPDQSALGYCVICLRPFDEDAYANRHWLHREGCIGYDQNMQVECDCDLDCHADHCPVCEPEEAMKYMNAEGEFGHGPDNSVKVPDPGPKYPPDFWWVTKTILWENNHNGTWSQKHRVRGQITDSGHRVTDQEIAGMFEVWMHPERERGGMRVVDDHEVYAGRPDVGLVQD